MNKEIRQKENKKFNIKWYVLIYIVIFLGGYYWFFFRTSGRFVFIKSVLNHIQGEDHRTVVMVKTRYREKMKEGLVKNSSQENLGYLTLDHPYAKLYNRRVFQTEITEDQCGKTLEIDMLFQDNVRYKKRIKMNCGEKPILEYPKNVFQVGRVIKWNKVPLSAAYQVELYNEQERLIYKSPFLYSSRFLVPDSFQISAFKIISYQNYLGQRSTSKLYSFQNVYDAPFTMETHVALHLQEGKPFLYISVIPSNKVKTVIAKHSQFFPGAVSLTWDENNQKYSQWIPLRINPLEKINNIIIEAITSQAKYEEIKSIQYNSTNNKKTNLNLSYAGDDLLEIISNVYPFDGCIGLKIVRNNFWFWEMSPTTKKEFDMSQLNLNPGKVYRLVFFWQDAPGEKYQLRIYEPEAFMIYRQKGILY